MTDMTVALRVFAETQGAQTGLRQMAEALRAMGIGAKAAAVDSAGAALRSATAWTGAGNTISGSMTAIGRALEAGVPDLSALLRDQAAEMTDTALASAEAAAGVAELRAMLHPLAGAAQAARDGLAEVALAEEMGALTAQEAAALSDRLSRALIEVARAADAAGLPLDGLGPSGRAAATGLQQLIEAQAGVSAASPIAEWLQQGQALDDLRARFSPVYAEARRLVTEMAQVADAEREGAISAREAALALDRLETALAQVQAQAAAAGVSLESLGLPARGAATDMQRLIEAQTGVTRATEGSIAAQLRQGQMLDELRARFNPVFATQQRYEQELRDIAEAERLTAITAREAADARERAAAAMAPLAGGIRQIGAESGAAEAYTANLGYQLNDIGMMMAAEQNPFMLMMQQGPQVIQILQNMQASGLSIGASLRSALMGMVSPLSLITMGVIGGGAFLVQWLTATGDEADKTGKKVKTFADKVDDANGSIRRAGEAARVAGAGGLEQLRREYGAVTQSVIELALELARIEQRAVTIKVEGLIADSLDAGLDAQLERAFGTVGIALAGAFADHFPALEAEIAALQADIASRQDMGVFVSPAETDELRRMREELAATRGEMSGIGSLASGIAVDPALFGQLAAAKAGIAAARAAGDFSGVAEGLREVHRLLVLSGQAIDQQVLDRLALTESAARRAADSLRQVRAAEMMRALPEPMSPKAFEAMEASWAERADLGRQAAMAALVAQHGRDSLEVARALVAEERQLYEIQLSGEDISDTERTNRLAAWDAAKGMVAVERERLGQLQTRLTAAQQEEAIQQAIKTHGADSVTVARMRAQAEREAREALVLAIFPAGDLRDRLIASERAGDALAKLDMASGISVAAAQARAMADEIVRALGAANALAAQGTGAVEDARLRWQYRDDPVKLAGALASANFARTVKLPAGAEDRDVARVSANEAGVVASAREAARINAALSAWQKAQTKAGKGGGGGTDKNDTLAGLSKEAQEILAALDIAAGGVAEKVRAGMMSVAEGETAMAQAKERAAGQLAELIARLERLGPAGKAAADGARAALKELAAEAGRADQSIREGMIKSFEDSFVRSLMSGKSAMSSFADHVQTELLRAFTTKFVTPMMTPLIDGIMGIFSGIFSAQGNVIDAGQVVPFAQGGVPDLPALATHRNTVVDRPTAFPMAGRQIGVMGEAGPEAILPLLYGTRGQGVRATAPDGSEQVLPLQRARGGALGVALPDVAASSNPAPVPAVDPVRTPIARMFAPGPVQPVQLPAEPVPPPVAPLPRPAGPLPAAGVLTPAAPVPAPPAPGPAPVPAADPVRTPIAQMFAPDPETAGAIRQAPGRPSGDVVPFAQGGVPDLPALATHRNTVVDRPTAFPMAGHQIGVMGEAGPEAILPLLYGAGGRGVRAMAPDGSEQVLPLQRARGGALGVALPDVGAVVRRPQFFADGGVVGRLSQAPRMGETVGAIGAGEGGGGGGRPVINLNIQNNHPGAKVEQKERQGSDGLSWDVVIEQIDSALADRGRRGIGSLAGMMGDQYGLSRVGR